jgi:hypothetical protein
MRDITPDFARSFANEWIAFWNSHDLDKVLSHYADNFTIESLLAARLIPESRGKITGKNAVEAYWTLGLKNNPDLEFKLLDVFTGTSGITIYYENIKRKKRALEILLFNEEGKVQRVLVHYALE